MATMISEYADRLDLIAYRIDGALTESRLTTLYFANPDLPWVLPEGLAVEVPESQPVLNYGSRYSGYASYATLAQLIDTAIPAAPITPPLTSMRGFGPGFGPGFG